MNLAATSAEAGMWNVRPGEARVAASTEMHGQGSDRKERRACLDDPDLWFYRDRTVALLKRYARMAVETGRLPSLLGRECFRARVTTYAMVSFEDMAIFVHDVEMALRRLTDFQQRLIALVVLEEYSLPEAAQLLGRSLRTLERDFPEALDELTATLIGSGVLSKM